MRLADAACGAVTRSYPWFNRSSLPVLTSNWSQEGSARWKQTFMPVHNGTQYSSELPDKEPHFLLPAVEACCFAGDLWEVPVVPSPVATHGQQSLPSKRNSLER